MDRMTVMTNDEKAEQIRLIMSKLYESLSYGAPETWPQHFLEATNNVVSVAVYPAALE